MIYMIYDSMTHDVEIMFHCQTKPGTDTTITKTPMPIHHASPIEQKETDIMIHYS